MAAIIVNPSLAGNESAMEAVLPPSRASVEMIPQGAGSVSFVPEDEKVKKAWRLCSKHAGTSVEIDLENESFKRIDQKQINELWDGVKSHLGSEAKNLLIDLTGLYIRYTDATGKNCYLDVSKADALNPNLLSLMFKIRRVSQKVWMGLGLGRNFNAEAARSGALRPLLIANEAWAQKMPKSIGRFIELGFFDQLCTTSKRSETEVLSSLFKMEKMIRNMESETKRQLTELQERIDGNDFRNLPSEEQKQIQDSKAQLTSLVSELGRIDRFALYWVAGVWGNEDPGSREIRLEKGSLISEGIQVSLRGELKPGEDTRWQITKFLGLNEHAEEMATACGPFITVYGGDAGDLVVLERLDYIRRIDESGREERAPSLIEFLSHAFTYIAKPDDFKGEEASKVLNLGINREILEAMKEVLNHPEDARGKFVQTQNPPQIRKVKITDPELKKLSFGSS